MGMGDVKLAGMLGVYLGRAVAPAIFIALITGVVVGAAIIARKGAKEGRKTAVPFGPFLALGGVIAFFAGADLVDAYLDTF
jgi:leader peptidase (prepilin peptidase)/N-methyltransferase